jgi:hypothetical protein
MQQSCRKRNFVEANISNDACNRDGVIDIRLA